MTRFWLCYDLGLRGRPDALYRWLDEHNAKECGESCATFESDKTRDQLARTFKHLAPPDGRLYLIEIKKGGKFIAGKRRVAPWAGYAAAAQSSDEIES
jgi:hypothetical protein